MLDRREQRGQQVQRDFQEKVDEMVKLGLQDQQERQGRRDRKAFLEKTMTEINTPVELAAQWPCLTCQGQD